MTDRPLALTVAICTLNRRDMAVRALNSLFEQLEESMPVEVLVVDNGSTDGAVDACRSAIEERGAPARIVVEPNVGLSHARNRSYAEAAGEYLAYLDDDAVVGQGWLRAVLSMIATHRPDLFGGPVLPTYDDGKPSWVTDELATSGLAKETRPMVGIETVSGGNMAVRKELLVRHGGFKTEFGMVAGKLGVGEETEFQIRLIAAGDAPDRWFCAEMPIHHLFPTSKTRPRYRLARARTEGAAYAAILISSGMARRSKLAWTAAAKVLARSLQALVSLPFCGSWSRWVFNRVADVCKSYGMLQGAFGYRPSGGKKAVDG